MPPRSVAALRVPGGHPEPELEPGWERPQLRERTGSGHRGGNLFVRQLPDVAEVSDSGNGGSEEAESDATLSGSDWEQESPWVDKTPMKRERSTTSWRKSRRCRCLFSSHHTGNKDHSKETGGPLTSWPQFHAFIGTALRCTQSAARFPKLSLLLVKCRHLMKERCCSFFIFLQIK